MGHTRRRLLATAAAAAPVLAIGAASASASVPATPPDPDAAVLAIGRRLAESQARLAAFPDDLEHTAGHPGVDAEVRRYHRALVDLGRVSALTPAGMLVKARALAEELEGGPTGYGEAIAHGLLVDLERLGRETSHA